MFENPANYKAALAGQRDLQVVGKLDKVPKTKEGVQEALQKFHQRRGPAAADKDPYRPQLDAPQHAANPGTATEGAEVFRGSGRGTSLKDLIKEMALKQRMAGATGGQNIAMNPVNNITVNGVASGREALMAKRTALAMRDHDAELLRQLKSARAAETRLSYT